MWLMSPAPLRGESRLRAGAGVEDGVIIAEDEKGYAGCL